MLDCVASGSRAAFRELVYDDPNFYSYFETATPIDVITRMRIGSRPAARRAQQGVADLRAIPWVFAWNQSRTNIPSWFGVGSALDELIGRRTPPDSSPLEELQNMYKQWPFFQSVLDNVHLGMGRADMRIAALYAQLTKVGYY